MAEESGFTQELKSLDRVTLLLPADTAWQRQRAQLNTYNAILANKRSPEDPGRVADHSGDGQHRQDRGRRHHLHRPEGGGGAHTWLYRVPGEVAEPEDARGPDGRGVRRWLHPRRRCRPGRPQGRQPAQRGGGGVGGAVGGCRRPPADRLRDPAQALRDERDTIEKTADLDVGPGRLEVMLDSRLGAGSRSGARIC